jgi:hypothetical protein
LKKTGKDIVIIGGGAAGFFAAITAGEGNPGGSVTILEKGTSVLGKVKVSGGGRCNVTNVITDPRELIKYYPRGGKALLGPFNSFSSKDTIQWFERRGVKLKAEPDGRIFPVTDDSQTIVECFIRAANKAEVNILTRMSVTEIYKTPKNKWIITTEEKEFNADAVIVCSGNSSTIWKIISELGHKIEMPVPSLFTFNIKDKRIGGLPGVSVPDAEIKVEGTKLKSSGPLLITHWGMSGPAILKLSAWGARELYNCNYKFELIINWLPGINQEQLKEKLIQIKSGNLNKNIYSFSPLGLPMRLWESLLLNLGWNKEFRWNNLSTNDLNKLASELTQGKFQVNGKSTFKEEFVTCGGVNTDEINFKTMESKIHKGLYFAGEVINIDGVTGGFNFQSAWTTGYLAGVNSSDLKDS